MLSLGAGGCVGEPDGVQAEADRCAAPGLTADEVKVGMVYPDSGGFAETFGPFRAGVDARFGLENARGGVNGRTITYEWGDDEGVPTKNLIASQELVEREGVFALLQASTATSGGAQYLADNGIPVVGIAAEPAWIEYRNMFSSTYVFTDGQSVDTFGQFVRERGGTRALIIGLSERNLAGGGLSGQLATSLTAAGVEVDPDSPLGYTSGVSSADRVAQLLRAKGVDTLLGAGTAAGFAEVVAAARRADVPLKAMMSFAAIDEELLWQYGPELAGMTFFLPHVPFDADTDGLRTYHDAMARYAPQLGEPDQSVALAGYIQSDVLIRGLQEAGSCPSREGFIERLRAVDGYTADGLVPRTDFDEDFGRIKECWAVVQVSSDGDRIELLDPNYCGDRPSG